MNDTRSFVDSPSRNCKISGSPVFFASIFLLLTLCGPGWPCDPEPGPLHFKKPPEIKATLYVGYFEAVTKHDGLPSNDFLFVTPVGDDMFAGSFNGLVIFNDLDDFRVVDSPDILPSKTVTAVCGPDRLGNIFIGTAAGLVVTDRDVAIRYRLLTTADGLPSNTITCLHLDASDNLWVGTEKGLALRQGFEFDIFGREKGLPAEHILSLGQYRGKVIAGTVNGPALHEGRFREIFSEYQIKWVSSIKEQKTKEQKSEGSLYLGTITGLFYRDRDIGAFFKEESGLPSNWVTAVEISKEHSIHDDENQFALLFSQEELPESQNKTFKELKKRADDLMAMYIRLFQNATQAAIDAYWRDYNLLQADYQDFLLQKEMDETLEGEEVWIGTKRHGLGVLARGEWNLFNKDNSRLTSDEITGLAVAPDNSVWISTIGGGINRYGKHVWDVEDWDYETPLLAGRITTVLPFGTALFIGTEQSGLFRYNPATGATLSLFAKEKVNSLHISCLNVDQEGNILVGTKDNGIFIITGDEYMHFTPKHGLAGKEVTTVFVDKVGRIFAGCRNASTYVGDKLSIFLGDSFFTLTRDNMEKLRKKRKKKDPALDYVRYCLEKIETEFITKAKEYRKEKELNKLPHVSYISAIGQNDFYFLIGTDAGLFIHDGKEFLHSKDKHGFTGGGINGITVTPAMVTYVGTDAGLMQHDGEGWTSLGSPPGFFKPGIDGVITGDTDPFAVWFWAGGGVYGSGIGMYDGSFKSRGYPLLITTMALDDPFIWIGTTSGLFMAKKR